MPMSAENEAKHNAMVDRINAMAPEAVEHLVRLGLCPFEPQYMLGVPIGMFHCEVCGEMVLAGVPHPRGMNDSEFFQPPDNDS